MAKRVVLKFYGMPLQIVVWFKLKRFQNSQQTVVTLALSRLLIMCQQAILSKLMLTSWRRKNSTQVNLFDVYQGIGVKQAGHKEL